MLRKIPSCKLNIRANRQDETNDGDYSIFFSKSLSNLFDNDFEIRSKYYCY